MSKLDCACVGVGSWMSDVALEARGLGDSPHNMKKSSLGDSPHDMRSHGNPHYQLGDSPHNMKKSSLGNWWDDLAASGANVMDILNPWYQPEANTVDIGELTVRKPGDLDPVTRARLEEVVREGRQREADKSRNATLVKVALAGGALVVGYLVLRSITK